MAKRDSIMEKGSPIMEKSGHLVTSESDNTLSTIDASAFGLIAEQDHHDTEDMFRLGKKQEYQRNFRLVATMGFSAIYSAVWEYVFLSTQYSLVNGGFAGLFWQYIWTSIGVGCVVFSLAEMASMAPTAGGQYHWVSEFAPPRMQRVLSYVSGWTSVIAWQPALASSLYPAVTVLGALRTFWAPDFGFKNWQASLIMIGMSLMTVPFNTVWRKGLATLETVVLVLHFLGFVVCVAVIWSLAPKNPSHEVFLDVVNSGGWPNLGLAMLVGQVSTFFTLTGADSTVHLAEEVDDASITVPRAMVFSYLLNASMGFVMVITMLYCIGDLNDAISVAEPFISVFSQCGPAAATGMSLILFILLLASNNSAMTTMSRQLWAFARDGGLPFSQWLSKVDSRWNVPFNAILVSLGITTLLCLINIGSDIAFNIIIGITTAGILSTYIVSLLCLIYSRLTRAYLPPSRWSLGKLGLPANIVAVSWASMVFVFSFFPTTLPVLAIDMNWTAVIFAFVVFLSIGFFIFHANTRYKGPVAYTAARRAANVIQSVDGDVKY